MKQRNPFAVFFLPFITFGIYGLVWEVKTKNEMNSLGAEIPTAWLLIIPLVNIYWLWKYAEGVQKVTNDKTSGALAFLLLFLLGSIGMAIVQSDLNKVASAGFNANNVPTPPSPASFSSDVVTPVAPITAVTSDVTPLAPTENTFVAPQQISPTAPAPVVSPETVPPAVASQPAPQSFAPTAPTVGEPVQPTTPTQTPPQV